MPLLNRVLEENNIATDLKQGQSAIGGEICGNRLISDKGTILSYNINGVEIMVINVSPTNDMTLMRDLKCQQHFYPIMFSDTLMFESHNGEYTEAKPCQSLSTGIYFSNENRPFICRKGVDVHLVILRVRREDFLKFIPADHPFIKLIDENGDYHFYELITSEIKRILRNLFHPNANEIFRYNLTVAYVWELFSLFVELFFFKRNSHYQSISEYDQIKLQQVHHALLDDLSKPKTIKELELVSSMCATKLRSMFKEVYGISIYQFFQRHRMEEAKRLLELGNMNVSDVAYTLGYSHLGYFTAAFKKQFGLLPKNITR